MAKYFTKSIIVALITLLIAILINNLVTPLICKLLVAPTNSKIYDAKILIVCYYIIGFAFILAVSWGIMGYFLSSVNYKKFVNRIKIIWWSELLLIFLFPIILKICLIPLANKNDFITWLWFFLLSFLVFEGITIWGSFPSTMYIPFLAKSIKIKRK